MSKFNVTNVALVLFLIYVVNCLYVFYVLFNPPKCVGDNRMCLRSKHSLISSQGSFGDKYQILIYTSARSYIVASDLTQIWNSTDLVNYQKESLNITLPRKTRKNGTLYAYVLIHPINESPFGQNIAKRQFELTKFAVPREETFNLIRETKKQKTKVPITHLKSKMVLNVLTDDVSFERMGIPGEIYHAMQFTKDGFYLPIIHFDTLSETDRHLKLINESTRTLELTIEYKPVSLGRLRLWMTIEQGISRMTEYGFTEKDINEIRSIFTDTNLYFLGLTFTVSIFHLLFDFLAFKNEISFWKGKKSMEGLSLRVVLWRCCSTAIIFLYLMDEKTSMLILVPAGIGSLIEFWKVTKALKIEVTHNGGFFPKFKLGEKSEMEQETENYDSEAMKYLSYLLYPLMLGVAVYSLLYHPHKSWYSWVIRSLVNGVYVFGFLFMLPQLFVNYKLKSVAHLPWRAFMYKAFNTFIDDVFAFIITMPTAHRLACFRDDFVFLIYLYQRWLYPVDKCRVNEYGMSFEEKKTDEKEKAD